VWSDYYVISDSIVGVHGFASNPFWTWVGKPKTAKAHYSIFVRRVENPERSSNSHEDLEGRPERPVIWLEQFLPKYVPRSRIVTFGYQSDYFRSAPKRDIDNCAQELLLALVKWRSEENVSNEPATSVVA
jgi:hypothetical protein